MSHISKVTINPIRLSYSTMELLNSCERKFQIERLLTTESIREDSPNFSFGAAFGVGIASFMQHKDINKAVFDTWIAFGFGAEDATKNCLSCVNAVLAMCDTIVDEFGDYDIAYFNGKPAAELSFKLLIDEGSYYVGYIDLVVQNRYDKRYAIVEVKTTAMSLLDISPMYANSSQAVGYSIILDKIAGADIVDYDVIYCVAQLNSRTPFSVKSIILPIKKTLNDRLHWFISLGLDVERIERMMELNTFPRRGGSCLKYNRPCQHFSTCHLQGLDTYKVVDVDTIDYDFTYTLDEVIQEHITRTL